MIPDSISKYDKLYAVIRIALGKYGIDCKTIFPDGTSIWKKVVAIIRPSQLENYSRIDSGEKQSNYDGNMTVVPSSSKVAASSSTRVQTGIVMTPPPPNIPVMNSAALNT